VVVTVEPGIYLIDSLLRAAREDKRGARIDWAVVEELHRSAGSASRITWWPRAARRRTSPGRVRAAGRLAGLRGFDPD